MPKVARAVLSLVILMVACSSIPTFPTGIGSAGDFAVLAASTVTNTGPTTIDGNVGVGIDPGGAGSVSGFSSVTLNGVLHSDDAAAHTAHNDLNSWYGLTSGQGQPTHSATELGGQTLTADVYNSSSGTFTLDGTLDLNAQGNPAAVFILTMPSTLTTSPGSHVNLINGAQACNVFWVVGSTADLGGDSVLQGTVIALTSINVGSGTTVHGRALAINGAVTLNTNTISKPTCAPVASASPTPTPTPTPSTAIPVVTATPSPSATQHLKTCVDKETVATGFKLYRNETYKYCIQIPKNWPVDAKNAAKVTFGTMPSGEPGPGWLRVSYFAKKTQTMRANEIQGDYKEPAGSCKESSATVAGKPGKKLDCIGAAKGEHHIYFLVSDEGNLFELNYIEGSGSQNEQYGHMVKTFLCDMFANEK